MGKYHLTWNCLGKFISCYFWLVWIILRHFRPGAKFFTPWLFFTLGIFGVRPQNSAKTPTEKKPPGKIFCTRLKMSQNNLYYSEITKIGLTQTIPGPPGIPPDYMGLVPCRTEAIAGTRDVGRPRCWPTAMSCRGESGRLA